MVDECASSRPSTAPHRRAVRPRQLRSGSILHENASLVRPRCRVCIVLVPGRQQRRSADCMRGNDRATLATCSAGPPEPVPAPAAPVSMPIEPPPGRLTECNAPKPRAQIPVALGAFSPNLSRVPSLKPFGRRPRRSPPGPSWGRHPKRFTYADDGACASQGSPLTIAVS